jgi:hypothetical protein
MVANMPLPPAVIAVLAHDSLALVAHVCVPGVRNQQFTAPRLGLGFPAGGLGSRCLLAL